MRGRTKTRLLLLASSRAVGRDVDGILTLHAQTKKEKSVSDMDRTFSENVLVFGLVGFVLFFH